MKNYGIILASGTGSRYNSDIPKQFVKIAGKTVLEHTIEIFERSKEFFYIKRYRGNSESCGIKTRSNSSVFQIITY